MSGGQSCICKSKEKSNWRIIDYRCNYSAFNGYHHTPSDYSLIRCLVCKNNWRTKANYVDELFLISDKEKEIGMSIAEFIRGFSKSEPKPIEKGDWCKNKDTGEYSICLNLHQGMYYGRTEDTRLTIGKIENFERV